MSLPSNLLTSHHTVPLCPLTPSNFSHHHSTSLPIDTLQLLTTQPYISTHWHPPTSSHNRHEPKLKDNLLWVSCFLHCLFFFKIGSSWQLGRPLDWYMVYRLIGISAWKLWCDIWFLCPRLIIWYVYSKEYAWQLLLYSFQYVYILKYFKSVTKLSLFVANTVENMNINFCCHQFSSVAHVQDSLSTSRNNW